MGILSLLGQKLELIFVTELKASLKLLSTTTEKSGLFADFSLAKAKPKGYGQA